MPRFEFFKEFPGRPDLALSHVLQALADTFFGLSLGGDIQQPLISTVLRPCVTAAATPRPMASRAGKQQAATATAISKDDTAPTDRWADP